MKIFDAFTFFNETELLKIRMELLHDVVDHFVIAESNLTHSGKEKDHILHSNWNDYAEYHDKMIYIPVQQSTEGLVFNEVSTYTPTDASWQLENQQRNALAYIRKQVRDDDFVLIGDLDEIPSPDTIQVLRTMPPPPFPLSMQMLFHYYYLNCQNTGYDRNWSGTVICTGKQFKQEYPQYYRDHRNSYYKFPNAGYHFSFMGGPKKIKEKIESFAHTEFNREDIKDSSNIYDAFENGKDVLKRPGVSFQFEDPEAYPENIRNIMEKYPHLVKWPV